MLVTLKEKKIQAMEGEEILLYQADYFLFSVRFIFQDAGIHSKK